MVARVRSERVAWAPRGGRLAFVDEKGGVAVVGRNGRRVRHLVTRVGGAESIVWSPNGRLIARGAAAGSPCPGTAACS